MQDPNPGKAVLGVFAKVVRGEKVKTRLQTALTRQEAERFHVVSLADTLETALRLVSTPFLFLQGEDAAGFEDLRARLGAHGLDIAGREAIRVRRQRDGDLGLRLEGAFETLSTAGAAPGPALILGSDSPSLPVAYVRAGMERLGLPTLGDTETEVKGRMDGTGAPAGPPHARRADQQRDRAAVNRPDEDHGDALAAPTTPPSRRVGHDQSGHDQAAADLVLGPTTDGGYWAIGLRRPCPGLLHDIAWSSTSTFDDTMRRAKAFGLSTALLPLWTDVDRPEDLRQLARQISLLRQSGDVRTARHSERFLAEVGIRHT